MIAYLEGRLTYKSPAVVYVDINGTGYEVQITLNTFTRIQHLERCKLLTYLLVREDAQTLYGFYDQEEKNMFLHLLNVSGVGAPTARMILSAMKPGEVQEAIVGENEKLLQSIKGIGGKTAKRIILELKDKMIKYGPVMSMQENEQQKMSNTLHADALNALLALGIARPAAGNAIRKATRSLGENDSLEMLIKEALKNL